MDKTRRTLLSAALAATVLPAVGAPTSTLRAVSFDGIALFDPRPVEAIAREALGEKTPAFMALWRSRQFEYTWLRSVMNRYADFEQVTTEALRFAQKTLGVSLDDATRARLVRQFSDLRAWPDVKPALEELRRLGYPTAIMSNFTEAMLQNAIRNSGLEHSLIHLMKLRASYINGCAYCADMHTKDARAEGETEQRLYAVPVWRETPFFTPRERAALAWTDAVNELGRAHVPDEGFEEVRQHFTDVEIVNLTMVVVTINGWNRIAIALRQVVGSYVRR